MREERRLSCWAQFRDEIVRIRQQYGYDETMIPEDIDLANGSHLTGEKCRRKNTVLFRGQSNESWPIKTTLERKTDSRPIHIAEYVTYADYCVNEIESLTGRTWNVPNYPDREKEIKETNDDMRAHLPAYPYLVYLRHHGFPSPLLDWTESPYIAAFFAFWEPPKGDDVAILTYAESVDGGRSLVGGAPMISVQGPYVTAHPRHFAQRTWYTIATQWNKERGMKYFCSHDEVFQKTARDEDILIKIILPGTVRKEALRELSDYNINPFTLFQTEDALVKTMELKQFDLEG